MTVFRYKALTADGRKISGTVEAANRREANQSLRERGMHVTAIKTSSSLLGGRLRPVSGGRVEQVHLFTSHMRRLLRARLPLLEALDATAAEFAGAPIGAVVARVRARVAGGAPLAESLAAESQWFDELYVSMVRAAQASGMLAAAFETIYQHEGRRRDFRRKLSAAVAYPVILVSVAVLAVVFLMSYVVPKVTAALLAANVPLPLTTRLLIDASGFAEAYWWAGAALVAALVAAPAVMRRFAGGRRFIDSAVMRVPLVRRFSRPAIVARFARTFASLLATGLRVADALEVAGKVSGNVVFEKSVSQARSRIVSGGELAQALGEDGLFPGYAMQIVGIGERTGTLAESFEEIARGEEEDLETATSRFLTFLEPVIIVVMAVVVGFIVASVLLPIMSLSTIGAS